ncbi:F-box/FBD/LRR-repeat protein At5g22660-like [Cornus florida]|uniref:F-box/FBD/LRR-repeat protein At5g22660-like n=2 Tax=Cornus florida TaxID=4283 RepID=UPI0028976A77|nr:F-box/FBD/LRR-repeat protein At5g22660-like [Cornus florida]
MKQRRLNSKFALRKCKGRSNHSEDRISQLPDEILICILSCLPMKEAARTSVVSSRWKELWTYTTGTFNFEALKLLRKLRRKGNWKILGVERANYISWVNRVLNSHKGATLDEFRIHFDLDSSSTSDIDNWVHFAMEKRVQRLELNLKRLHSNIPEGHYNLSSMRSLDFSRLESLTAICFTYVDVTAECLECFLSSYPFLEEVSVDNSACLVNVKVYGQSLKHLKIAYCWFLEDIEISAKSLVSLEYFGHQINLCFKSACHLSKLNLGGQFCKFMKFSQFSSYTSQLQTLVLKLDYEVFDNFPKFPELRNLKHLTLKVYPYRIRSFLPCISLIEAAPCLYRFCLEVFYGNIDCPGRYSLQGKVVQGRAEKRLLKCPKVVELVGFTGCEVDVELAMYLFENFVSLEKINIDTRPPYLIGAENENVEDENRLAAKMCAMGLQSKLPRGVELMII